ncbi:MAG: electron transfer flavoprotein subunit alpha/FixB family protein [Acidimicrobiales bacterium]
MKVLCFVEHDAEGLIDPSVRALAFARKLAGAGEVVAVASGRPGEAATAALSGPGVTDLHCVILEAGYAPLLIARGVGEAAGTVSAGAVVAAATDHGNEILAHLGALSGRDFVANCTSAEASSEGIELTRQRWGGSLVEETTLRGEVAILSVAVDALFVLEAAPGAPGAAHEGVEVVEVRPGAGENDQVVEATERREQAGGVSLASAKVVVSGGRGMGGEGAFSAIEQLAGLLGGAVGVSRAVTSLGWRPHSEQVGQTGTRVTPDLYIACGISGAIQHLAGCQAAKTMVAINTDAEAPIMSRADYAVIGDVNEVLPALVEAIAARRTGSSREH